MESSAQLDVTTSATASAAGTLFYFILSVAATCALAYLVAFPAGSIFDVRVRKAMMRVLPFDIVVFNMVTHFVHPPASFLECMVKSWQVAHCLAAFYSTMLAGISISRLIILPFLPWYFDRRASVPDFTTLRWSRIGSGLGMNPRDLMILILAPTGIATGISYGFWSQYTGESYQELKTIGDAVAHFVGAFLLVIGTSLMVAASIGLVIWALAHICSGKWTKEEFWEHGKAAYIRAAFGFIFCVWFWIFAWLYIPDEEFSVPSVALQLSLFAVNFEIGVSIGGIASFVFCSFL